MNNMYSDSENFGSDEVVEIAADVLASFIKQIPKDERHVFEENFIKMSLERRFKMIKYHLETVGILDKS